MPDDESNQPPPATDDKAIAALLREREGYVRRELPERVAQVDAELKRRGHRPPAGGEPPKRETTDEPTGEGPPRGRRAPGKSRA